MNQRECCLLTDTRHSGNVVDGITGKPLNIDHLVRLDPKFSPKEGKINGTIFHGIPDGGFIGDQLHEILVPGDHDNRIPLVFSQARGGADEIIGFKTRHFYDRQVECCGNFFDIGQLNHHVFRHGRAVGLVVFIYFVTKGWPFAIKEHSDIFRRTFFHEF